MLCVTFGTMPMSDVFNDNDHHFDDDFDESCFKGKGEEKQNIRQTKLHSPILPN